MIERLQEKLRSKEASAVELSAHYLKRVKADRTNSFITVCENEARAMAQQADRLIAAGQAGPLTGVPLALKDLLCTKGVRTTCASKILADYLPPYDATAVAKLREAGSVFLGKLNMDEFAMGGSNENSAFGPVRNPVDPDYVPGGSSGGSAAAVKAGLAAATLGSDTGGSVRLPAAYSGVVGLKPTYGLISRFGLVAFASSLDQIGPMTVNVDDSAILLSALAGYDPLDSTSAPRQSIDYSAAMKAAARQKLKLGVPREYFGEGLQKEVGDAVARVIEALKKAGHEVVEVELPNTRYAVAVYYVVAVSEASSNLARFDGVRFGARLGGDRSLNEMYRQTRSLFGAEVKRRVLLGTFALSAGYYDAYYKKACQVRRLIKNDFDRAFERVDALVAPVSPTTAFKIGEKNTDPLRMYLNDILTIPVNLAGLPGLSVPAGRDSNGLPIGVQFIGKHFAEADILALGKFVEDHVHKEEVDHGI